MWAYFKKNLMKNSLTYFLAVALFLMFSCKNNNNGSTENSLTTTADADTDEMQMPEYYDLQTSRPVDIMEDSNTHLYVDVSTQKPLNFYYDAISHDTFDIHGRIINNALVQNNGTYSVDESKVKSNNDALKARTENMKKMMEKNK
jgi:hypothetical protein